MNEQQRIARLLWGYSLMALTSEQELELTAWRKRSPENEELLHELTDRMRRDAKKYLQKDGEVILKKAFNK